MTERMSLYDFVCDNFRATEDSLRVAKYWQGAIDPYLSEIPIVEFGKESYRKAYFDITAERLLFRKKLLGLPVDENLVADEHIATAHPFGEANPTFGELTEPSVRLAAAFVPLTPDENDVTLRPVMARLYCIAGLSGRYALPLTEGLTEAGIQNYNWFVAGVKDDVLEVGISGRSWLLAANLLMQIIERNDMATARNLIKNFIVTGNVEDGAISHVTIGRKQELDRYEFRNFKWIVPMNNANEMTAVPVRRIEKPATLDEAYQLIETMQSKATRSFFRFLKNGDIAGMKEQYDIGADIFVEDEETKLTPLMYADKELKKKIEALGEVGRVVSWGHDCKKWNERLGLVRAMKSQAAVLNWLKAKCADCCGTIYLLAKHGMKHALEEILRMYPVNALDENGLTATDLALIDGDFDTTRLLVSMGGLCDRLAVRNQILKDILYWLPIRGGMTDDYWRFLGLAMDAGLSVDAKVHFCDIDEDENGHPYHKWDLQLPLVGLAVYDASERLLDLCLKHGVKINEAFAVDFIDDHLDSGETPDMVVEGQDFRVVKSETMTPLEFAYYLRTFDKPSTFDDSFIAVLKKLGAKETDASIEKKTTGMRTAFMNAIGMIGKKGETRDNRNYVITRLMAGESFDIRVNGVVDEIVEGAKVAHPVTSSLYGIALEYGWLDIVQTCLELGASPDQEIEFISREESMEGDVYERIKPLDIARRNKSSTVRKQLVDILEKSGAKD